MSLILWTRSQNEQEPEGTAEQTTTSRTFKQAVEAVLYSPPTPEQQVKKAAAKAHREARKRQKQKQAEEKASEQDKSER